MRVRDVMSDVFDRLGPLESPVDTVKTGSLDDQVRGIATTFMPSVAVLTDAATRGLNLVIAHEAPFFHHRDDLSALAEDPVYQEKAAMIRDFGLTIFRLHDHLHRPGPDRIVDGLVRELGWQAYVEDAPAGQFRPLNAAPLAIPPLTLAEIIVLVKARLRIDSVRVMGALSQRVTRVGILPGYCGGGALAIPYLREANLDLVIVGEGPEWETPEYVRDAIALGQPKAMILVGHGPSEEPGMKVLASDLKTLYPTLPVEFLAGARLFTTV